jgi:hypothetical protein
VHGRAIAADDRLPDALVVDDNGGHRISGLLQTSTASITASIASGRQALLDQALRECRRRHGAVIATTTVARLTLQDRRACCPPKTTVLPWTIGDPPGHEMPFSRNRFPPFGIMR